MNLWICGRKQVRFEGERMRGWVHSGMDAGCLMPGRGGWVGGRTGGVGRRCMGKRADG